MSVIDSLKRRFSFRKKLPKRSWAFPDLGSFNLPANILIYLIGFSYGSPKSPTSRMFTWLRDILTSDKVDQTKILRFNDSKSDRQLLAKSLEDRVKRVEIFCGHGLPTGLVGPPQGQVAGSILSDLTYIIYDVDMITPTPSSMFAFCCQAAQTFGRVFASYKDKQFLGFIDDIPFPLELYDDLKYVFQIVAKDIIQQGQISDSHKQLFLSKLNEIASQPLDYQNRVLVDLWLGEYRKHLRLYS